MIFAWNLKKIENQYNLSVWCVLTLSSFDQPTIIWNEKQECTLEILSSMLSSWWVEEDTK